MTKKIEFEEPKPEEQDQTVKFKITKKKKSVTETKLEPEPEEPEKIEFKLKKVTKKKVNRAKEVEEKVPVEEVAEFARTPTDTIEFIEIEGMEIPEISSEGVF